MATKRYLDARYDVTGLSEDEVDRLAGEVAAQAERSEGHPSVEVEIETNDVEVDTDDERVRLLRAVERANALFQAYDAAGDTSRANGSDGRDELLASELVFALRDRPSGSVANVLFDDHRAVLVRDVYSDGSGKVSNGSIWFNPYVALYDPSDPDDDPLFLMYGDPRGKAATLLVPGTTDVGELERRLVRFFGDAGWTIDDFQDLAR